MKISRIIAREIFDSRGLPTIECSLFLEDGRFVKSSVPSGASTGKFEAHELRDGGKRLFGKGVSKAINNIESIIAPALIGKEVDAISTDLILLNLDGTDNKSKLGANAILAVSMAAFRAQALVQDMELYELIAHLHGTPAVSIPFAMMNFINGGMHADNFLRIQEFMILPTKGSSFRQSVESSIEVYYKLKELLKENERSTAIGDEGGFASEFANDLEALDFLVEAIAATPSAKENEFGIALDVAASEFYNSKKKIYDWNGKIFTSEELANFYISLVNNYPILSIEDGFAEDDWKGWETFNSLLGEKIQIVGDDLFVTNPERIHKGIEKKAANASIIKPNQIGTITETLQAVKLCQENGFATVISHRSGETNDSFISDLAVGTAAGQIKSGACVRGERLAKYNRLLEIEDSLVLGELDRLI
ncbi:MAG: Enolase [candidate division TM6 bacterium GW2011_GWF2_32_72]|nr:MAG: Enolase [candidate division TM6 bacterium GW2011_GWF2_32_72]